uniref:Cysteine-rich receptor-like protein kinase 1 n=1 Tax=Populus alba TaxID=43335 RepID=A0A4U5MHT7_POPAL|nr:cysteine-rich receptor-like protein kinase 1 [Populus alba]
MDSLQKQVGSRNWGCGFITSPLLQIYGLAQCHDDLSSVDCKICFFQGRVKLPRCLPATSARIYLNGCFIRYDNYNFFHEAIDPMNDAVVCGEPTNALTDSFLHMEFKQRLAAAIQNVTAMALGNGTFAAAEVKGRVFSVYALAQCWNTLGKDECRKCLVKAGSKLSQCAPGSGGSAFFAGCYMKYSTQHFFKKSVESKARCDNTGIVVAVTLSTVVFVVLASFGAFIGYERLSKRKGGEIATKKLYVLDELSISNLSISNLFCSFLSLDKSNLRLSPNSSLNFTYEVLEKATEGYMAPEYLVRGQLTEKVDVYGFGVLLLEIATGRKNSVFSQGSSSILHSVWKHHKANTITDMVDPGLRGMFSQKQAEKVLQIGLLCTQASSRLRPSMNGVVQMLTDAQCEIPSPKQPPFLNASVLSPDGGADSCITEVSLTCNSVVKQQTTSQETLLGDPSKFRRYR